MKYPSRRLAAHAFSPVLSRREFLKLSGLGAAGWIAGSWLNFDPRTTELQGRVIESKITIFDIPSLTGKKVGEHWKDVVLPIHEVTLGVDDPEYNRVWYQVQEHGYAHSSGLQPVQTRLNTPVREIPLSGVLAEVTVPFTDAYYGMGRKFPFAYRLYYETVHWVVAMRADADGRAWYHIIEDKWDDELYAPAAHLRLVSNAELSPLSSELPPHAKRLAVHTHQQAVVAYEWDRPVFAARAATGAQFSNGNFATPPGRFMTFHKRPSRHMAAGNLAFNGYDLPGVPWISYFTESGISFHGTYWHNNFGRPRSHGCVNLTPQAAKWIYRWTLPGVPAGEHDVYESFGTIVDVLP